MWKLQAGGRRALTRLPPLYFTAGKEICQFENGKNQKILAFFRFPCYYNLCVIGLESKEV